jgi:hypothetical protein
MHSVVAFCFIPARNALDCRRFALIDIQQHFAVHVFAYRQPKQVEKCRADIEESSAVDSVVLSDVGTSGNKDTELAMLDRWASRLARNASRTQVIGVETMIR